MRKVFEAGAGSNRVSGKEFFEESPNRDTLAYLSTSLMGARLDDPHWLNSDGSQQAEKTPTGVFRGMAMSLSVPLLPDD